MILLITGASHTGKTLLAQRMLEQYHYPYLSIDHLKMGLIRSRNTDLTPLDDDALTDYLWPIVREIVKTAAENRQNLIVEGCYIPPDWRRGFDEAYLPAIRFVCLAMTDRYIDAHFHEILSHGSDIEARLDDTDCTPEALKADNRKYISAFEAHGERVALIDVDCEQTMRLILDAFDSVPEKLSDPAESPEKKKTSDFIADGVLAYGVEVGRLLFRQAKKVVYALSDLPHVGPSDVTMLYQISKKDYARLLAMSLPHAIPDPPVPAEVTDACRRGFLCGESAYCHRTSCSLADADPSLTGTWDAETAPSECGEAPVKGSHIILSALESADREQFILDNQAAFRYGATEEFGLRADHFEEDGEIISRETIARAIDGGEAYRIELDGEKVGGLVLRTEGDRGELELLFVSPKVHSKGIGYAAWCAVEQMHPEVAVWETVTPYFEKRNIHFYVNRCGFHIVEYYNSHHPDPNETNDAVEEGGEMFRFQKVLRKENES